MSEKPVVNTDYLYSILDLQANQTISLVEITEVKESTTAIVLKVCVHIKNADNINLFVKTMKHNKTENAFHSMSMNEGNFYKFLKDNSILNLPVPECYDVFLSEEKGEFVIVLEDISNRYTPPDSKILADKNTWFSCAESLAKFHAALWNHELIPQIEEYTQNFDEDRNGINSFISEFNDKFDAKTKTILGRVATIKRSQEMV